MEVASFSRDGISPVPPRSAGSRAVVVPRPGAGFERQKCAMKKPDP
jgi:hypothetical protein